MGIKINSFGGPFIWILRKYYSKIISRIMLEFTSKRYNKITKKYIDWFLNEDQTSIFQNVMIETINRCNCEFCPARIKTLYENVKRDILYNY